MKAAAAALLGLALAGCAPATFTRTGAATPVSPWHDDTRDADDEVAAERAMSERLAQARTTETAAAADDDATSATPDAPGSAPQPVSLEPDMIHQARIEMAREALVEENENKERVDLAEELQRELAALQASAEASKSRGRSGRATKNQP